MSIGGSSDVNEKAVKGDCVREPRGWGVGWGVRISFYIQYIQASCAMLLLLLATNVLLCGRKAHNKCSNFSLR